MDDIQFWIYIIFAAIYFFARMMKKKAPEDSAESPSDTEVHQPRRKAVSFEDLLKEIQEQHRQTEERQVVVESPKPVAKKEPKRKKEEEPQDGVRKFYDDESRRVYEESIKMAEGYDIKFERGENFKSKGLRRKIEDEESSSIGSEILSSLQNPDSARKAVILGEILNRKY